MLELISIPHNDVLLRFYCGLIVHFDIQERLIFWMEPLAQNVFHVAVWPPVANFLSHLLNVPVQPTDPGKLIKSHKSFPLRLLTKL